ncbi:uracil phosphoribosyltransferase [Clonorchis sinensis]|uniref:Uracil phosphoribosyltransferase n=1 Tax=Clonorchis sinensis TaxID=79923 RepID=G7YCW3_CLOSI|nr:uracil phosphoribosyltransferase [Clonorchis sinensis]
MHQLLHTKLAICSRQPQLGTKRRLHTFDELVRQQLLPRHSFQSRQSVILRMLQAGDEHGRVTSRCHMAVLNRLIASWWSAGHSFHGVKFLRGNCGVSVVRSGEAMERGLRDCCRSIRIGKILIQANNEDGSNDVKVYYAKLPPNISQRKILLMYPILGSGNTVLKALDVLRTYDVPIENVILLTLFVSPEGLRNVLVRNPVLRVVTSEVHPVVPTHFGQRYFGTS